jgi:hypothetical protein
MQINRRFVVLGLAFAIACLPQWAVAGDSSEQKAWAADEAFLAALAQGNGHAVKALLLPDFSWTTSDGKQLDKSAATTSLTTLTTNAKDETDVQRYFYGQLATVRGSHTACGSCGFGPRKMASGDCLRRSIRESCPPNGRQSRRRRV